MKTTIKIARPGNIRDVEVLSQIPKDLLEQLGEIVSKDYTMKTAQRTITFENGFIQYRPYHSIVIVSIEDQT